MPGEPLDQLLESVDPGASHLVSLPSRLWIFGGQFATDPNAAPASLRDSFWRQTLLGGNQLAWLGDLDRPENHSGWWAFSGYDDLLEFERDACYLARGVVLFPESPGAYAEFGSLALDPSILPRLMVIVESSHLQEERRESFLNLGPLKRVERSKGRCVIGTTPTRVITPVDYKVITDFISEWLPSIPGSSALEPLNPTHRLLLLADLVDLLLVSKLVDLQRALDYFGVHMAAIEIQRALNLLDFFRLAKLDHLGKEPFGVRRRLGPGPWISYRSRTAAPFDRSRFKTLCLKWVQGNARRNAIFERSQ